MMQSLPWRTGYGTLSYPFGGGIAYARTPLLETARESTDELSCVGDAKGRLSNPI